MANISSYELVEIFDSIMSTSSTYELLDGMTNPCHILFEGVEYFVYIKNLSPAYFSNKDVYRAQLTGVDSLKTIKDSSATFILLGYDSDNQVYAAWNPHMAKQRIGTAASPSFYSRLSLQEEASETKTFVHKPLKNNGDVLVFPYELIDTFIANINTFFSDTSEYVAMGSKRRMEANNAYKLLINTHHLEQFSRYLSSSSCSDEDAKKYADAIRYLINKSIINEHRKIFLAYDSILNYIDAVETFLALEEIKTLDASNDNIFSYAMQTYVDFLVTEYGDTEDEDEPMRYIPDESTNSDIIDGVCDSGTQTDYETPYIDANGNLTRIVNPELIEKLKEDLATEFPRPAAAYATIEEFYGDRFPNMQISNWQKLFAQIDWANPYKRIVPYKATKTTTSSSNHTSRQKVCVEFPDGTKISENKVVETLIAVIKYAGVERVQQLGITMGQKGGGGLMLINESVEPDSKGAFREVNGFFVNTCSNTPTKFEQINRINKALDLGLKVELV